MHVIFAFDVISSILVYLKLTKVTSPIYISALQEYYQH